ncbi:uncharacterized protein LOC142001963 [Carettochelys insculpta]|uniref:uncharacterized protein LOC142001963 n=1 Tax=Carettochelys insculpta TaxID=44489 RepID=UPI003EBB35D5
MDPQQQQQKEEALQVVIQGKSALLGAAREATQWFLPGEPSPGADGDAPDHRAPLFLPRRLLPCRWSYPSSSERWEHLVMQEWDDNMWLRSFRMRQQTFLELCQWLTPTLRHQNTRMRRALPVEKRVVIAFWKLATPDGYCSVGHQFGAGKATVGAVVMEVVRVFNAMVLQRVIRLGDLDAAIAGFAAMGFPNCFGALDGTHIPIHTPDHSGGRYINRRGYHSVVLQAMVDSRGHFQDVYMGWPCCTHNAHVFWNSGLCHWLEVEPYIPEGDPSGLHHCVPLPRGRRSLPPAALAHAPVRRPPQRQPGAVQRLPEPLPPCGGEDLRPSEGPLAVPPCPTGHQPPEHPPGCGRMLHTPQRF